MNYKNAMSYKPSFDTITYDNLTNTQVYRSWTGYNYTFLFAFEKKFFNVTLGEEKLLLVEDKLYNTVLYSLAYLLIIFAGRKFMEKRDKFILRHELIAWNFVLAGFSMLGVARLLPEFLWVVQTKGLRHSYCTRDYIYGVTGGWCVLFAGSKFPELIDTFFIVARKQKLIFLHWFHHFSVLLYAAFSAVDYSGSARWFSLMNFTVHAFMYTYYGFRACRFRIPKWVSMMLTGLQILQMVIGCYINITGYLIKKRGEHCEISDESLNGSFLIFLAYLILFVNFFIQSYLKPKVVKANAAAAVNGNGHLKVH